jgi:hypothetical protein
MKNSCNIIPAFCSQEVQEKIQHLYKNLETQGLIPHNMNLEMNNFIATNNNLFFVSYNENTKHNLRHLINETHLKNNHIVIISSNDENYFDFAIKYNICNIIHITKINETILFGIIKRFFEEDINLESFFEKRKNIFDKKYVLAGKICMRNLIENTYTDFLEKIPAETKNTFIINCHELVTNAIAYGVLGITTQTRDKKIYEIGNHVNIPEKKHIETHLFMNKELYGISIKDFGGTLTIRRILERIRRQSIVAGETIPPGIEDYTGRGFAILCRHGLLTFSIKPNEFTVVSLISDIKITFEKKPISILAMEL